MNEKIIYLGLLLIAICAQNSLQECLCNVRRNGEYCGTELNQINGNSDCDRNMYYCGNTNRNKTAVLLVSCPEGRECDVRIRGRNACLRHIQCRCGRGLGRGPYCGSQLNGRDCGPNVTFTCRRIGSPSPQDACPEGCNEGKCVVTNNKVSKTESVSESTPIPGIERESVTMSGAETHAKTEP